MIKIILTVGVLTAFCYTMVTEMEKLKDTAVELKSSVIVFQNQNERLLKILDKIPEEVSEEDFKPFNNLSVKLEKEELKKIVLEEIDKESKDLEVYYKDLKIESITKEDLENSGLLLEKDGIYLQVEEN